MAGDVTSTDLSSSPSGGEPVLAHGARLGEVYVLGDNPSVLLTALWTGFEPSPATSPSVTRPCPRLLDSGNYEERPDGRPLRVFTGIGDRLMFDDLYAKLALHAGDPTRP
jgi:purine nucleosidase